MGVKFPRASLLFITPFCPVSLLTHQWFWQPAPSVYVFHHKAAASGEGRKELKNSLRWKTAVLPVKSRKCVCISLSVCSFFFYYFFYKSRRFRRQTSAQNHLHFVLFFFTSSVGWQTADVNLSDQDGRRKSQQLKLTFFIQAVPVTNNLYPKYFFCSNSASITWPHTKEVTFLTF